MNLSVCLRKGAACALAMTSLVAPAAAQVTSIQFFGQATFPARSITVGGTTVGGLSGIAYDGLTGNYYALSDDQGNLGLGSPRYYTMRINAGPNNGPNSFTSGDVSFTGVTTFTNGGVPFGTGTVDLEGISLARDRKSILVPDEGFANTGVTPKIHRFDRVTGAQIASYEAPSYYKSDNAADPTGIRNNTAFE